MPTHTKKRPRGGGLSDEVEQRCLNYRLMLTDLMRMLQEYLLLSDTYDQRRALESWRLVDSSAELHDENTMCLWLEELYS